MWHFNKSFLITSQKEAKTGHSGRTMQKWMIWLKSSHIDSVLSKHSLSTRMRNELNFKTASSESRVLLVDGQEQLPLVHADSGVVSFSWKLSVLVDKPSLSQHICSSNFYLVKGHRKSPGEWLHVYAQGLIYADQEQQTRISYGAILINSQLSQPKKKVRWIFFFCEICCCASHGNTKKKNEIQL